jgi:glycosyltransferase involved in cell wall biosynthesis
MADPRVTVVINTYNDKRCVGKAIRSVLDQSVRPHEIIVIDDGSTDGTRDFVEREFGTRLRYHYHANRGIGGSRKAWSWDRWVFRNPSLGR